MSKIDVLPSVRLDVSGCVFKASGDSPWPWSIRAEAETDHSARTIIKLGAVRLADVTIHGFGSKLVGEVQAVSAAILWSGMRAMWAAEKDGVSWDRAKAYAKANGYDYACRKAWLDDTTARTIPVLLVSQLQKDMDADDRAAGDWLVGNGKGDWIRPC